MTDFSGNRFEHRILSSGDSPASEFYVPMFWNALSILNRRYIKFRYGGITRKKEYDIYNRFEHVLEKVLIDGQLNSVVFIWRIRLAHF